MSRVLILIVYSSLIVCGLVALLGSPSPTLERQGGGVVTLAWSSLCMAAGCLGIVSAWWRLRPWWEILAALTGAATSGTWVGSLILQGINAKTLNTASAACMGLALTALLAHRARRLSGGT